MEIVKKYFPILSKQQLEQFSQLQSLYEDWNAKIKLISRKDMDQFYGNHVLHSLTIAHYYTFKDSDNVMDIGTGGGFPGIPLAILFPNVKFTLVDSIKKKTKVVQEVAASLNLQNVSVVNDRFENIEDKYSVIVSRAVAPALKLVKFTKRALAKKGKHIFIKGGDLTNEKKELLSAYKNMKWKEFSLSDNYDEPFFETKKVIILN